MRSDAVRDAHARFSLGLQEVIGAVSSLEVCVCLAGIHACRLQRGTYCVTINPRCHGHVPVHMSAYITGSSPRQRTMASATLSKVSE